MDFIALDVETANADMSSICALGLVHFKAGQIFKNLSTLIDPEDHFDPLNISVHGIRPEDVIGKPTMKTLYPALQANLSNCVLVHHSHFDKTALQRAAQKCGFAELECHWLDSCRLARLAWPNNSSRGYGLATLAKEFSITFDHHRPEEDARCAGLLVLKAIADTGIPLEDWCAKIENSSRTNRRAREKYPERIVLPASYEGPLTGEIIVFTGELSMERRIAANLATAAGAQVSSGVNQQTTILVVGEQDARLLNGHDKSSKHRKAEQLIQKGCPIRIVTESGFEFLAGVERK